ncbi:glycosyltransferase family 4 protein [Methylomonas sp. UP202]|uniref:glycosyltransferase family 4 protein n=1 Tax=Methylomonas sp. UP202 TaxID=3040943 RepID=UPI0024791915|nr:glycosyltransferase family 4 protein [Methylomonas sp. UP202]WGS86775.1 glycosyltransferase family 4 protein [Methylomonas sp. UP202]
MARIAIFSKYFGYNVGGAEHSVLELLKQEEAKGHTITAVIVDNVHSHSADQLKIPLPESWQVQRLSLPADTVRFRFVAYWRNRHALTKFGQSLQGIDTLYAYGLYAPAVINAFSGETVYLVRDEYGLGWNRNYHRGFKRWLFWLYRLSEWPLERVWLRDLYRAIAKSRLIANSSFIASELSKLSPEARIELRYSQVDTEKLQADYARHLPTQPNKGIVLIGDNILKGGDIARRIAERLPERTFYFFDRRYQEPRRDGNRVFMPWQSPGYVYAQAELIIVPSRWQEAFPRAVLEAQVLGIPVVASACGGIPEALADSSALIDDPDDIETWVTKIDERLRFEAGAKDKNPCA